MKTNLFYALICTGFLALSSCGGSGHEGHNQETEEVAKVQYTCTMHPEVVQDEPGDCPKCNMKLVEKDSEMKMDEEHSH